MDLQKIIEDLVDTFLSAGNLSLQLREKGLSKRIKSDNTTAVVYINNMGGVKSLTCHSVAKEIWIWAIERKIHLSAEHLPGSSNVLADKASRIFDENTEWELNVKFFRIIESRFGEREIDLFFIYTKG